ncbi:inactive hydroxysteroid dehydrogenase-like protein 1 isoform X2 [Liolophura sinensis]|uniref:inactive hydroxysteroid dehydrogenase-like protein 1 isoform X2 n=1 Tax=Liolophura sinensis TaxID=3198878 RepID=UPI003158039D
MAAAIDRFEFLVKEISCHLSSGRDTLAVVGALYVVKKTIDLTFYTVDFFTACIAKQLGVYRDLSRRFGPWAVVTGSSEGIGRAYAQELASKGLNIILISKGENRLSRAAEEIRERYRVETIAVTVDFNAGRDVYDRIRDAIKGKEIGILVNNVGVMYDYPQMFLDVPERMTHMILPQMVKRRRGAIVIVSSGACSQITPQMTAYAATKSYLDYFARAIGYEYKDKGIVVQSLLPFYVATRMTQFSKTLSKSGLFIPSATVYAQHAVSTLGYSNRTTGYWPHTIQSWFSALIPERVWMWGASRLNTALRRQAHERLRRHSLRISGSYETSQDSTPEERVVS